ncbi:hypothetical protein I4U23_020899 [Adineta vaga]|nr:hypothetical protein I4U23_020899 [Adineta vaga]
MLRRNQKNSKKKVLHRKSSVSHMQRSIPLNINAYNQPSIVNPTSRLESMANLMIQELCGTQRDNLKHELLTSYISNMITTNNLPLSSSKRSLEQLLSDIHTLDRSIDQQSGTTDITDHELSRSTLNLDKDTFDAISTQSKSTNLLHDESPSIIVKKRRRNLKNPVPSKTICTRSSKFNSLNTHENENNHIISNRARKQQSSSINTDIKQNSIINGEDISGVKVSRKKLQSTVQSPKCSEITNDF